MQDHFALSSHSHGLNLAHRSSDWKWSPSQEAFLPILSTLLCSFSVFFFFEELGPSLFLLNTPLRAVHRPFWSCIKEEMGKKHYRFCVLSDSKENKRKKERRSLYTASPVYRTKVCDSQFGVPPVPTTPPLELFEGLPSQTKAYFAINLWVNQTC